MATSVQYPTSIIHQPPVVSVTRLQDDVSISQYPSMTDAGEPDSGTPRPVTAGTEQITELRAEFYRQPREQYGVHQKVSFVWPNELALQGSTAGKLDEQSAKILQALSADDISIQLSTVLPGNPTYKQGVAAVRNTRDWFPCSVILYGPDDMFEDIGAFCQECKLYLQDPIGCELNVPYRNPHRISTDKERPLLTFELQSDVDQTVTVGMARDAIEIEEFIITSPDAGTVLHDAKRIGMGFP
ncbi:hypothetical protein PtrM4_083910 [Pyrenophora tritici-repentis]|uniref:Uncharacterized protein n=1 Tax=Pyrenophora tritici-repentis TaxID=45151 RepID=A0A834VQT4_9PLEO|nr:hypothetical protein PtrM4_083910 [Pyrenophora tritici-repentis]